MTQSKPPNLLVLVADDDPDILALVTRQLRSMSLPYVEASDGETAFELAKKNKPDLVVLDVMMPGMTGWEVCRSIREEKSLAKTGIIMLTGIGESLNSMTSPLYGADEYIDKPFELPDLETKIRKVLAARKGME